MRDFGLLFFILLFLVSVFGVSGALAYWVGNTECHEKLRAQALAGNYGFWTDCMVQLTDGTMVPLESYNMQRAIERGTLDKHVL
jgi:hypothetical protein